MHRRPLLTVLAATLLVAFGMALAQPRVVDYSGLGIEPGTVGGSVTLPLGAAPPTFLYYAQIDNATQALTQQVFDSLVEFNLQTYALEPALAESWEVSEDGTVYTFHLREGVTWHDGEPFTAEDVVFTYEQIITNPEARAGDAAQFTYTVDGEQQQVTFEAVDDHTVVITLPAPSAAFLLQQRFFIMPKHKLVDFTVEGGAEAGQVNNAWPTDVSLSEVVGTGPFMYDSYTPGQLVVLTRNPNYWKQDTAGNQLPYLDSIEYRPVADGHKGPTAARAQFQIGECLFAQRRFDDAVAEFLKVEVLYAYPQWSAAALYEAGRCFEAMGQSDEARRQFERVQQEYNDTKWAPMAASRLAAVPATTLPGR